ncbi:MAG: DUF2155 domain-containing protein [Deltaproteobacteria bacterium]|nr:DUF2155 domain-containing protein [Deltaproteobacteria bacterium]
MNIFRRLAVVFIITLIALGCSKDNANAPANQQTAPAGTGAASGTVVETPVGSKPAEIVTVPDNVKAKWKNVKIDVSGKTESSTETITVPIGGRSAIAGTGLTISVRDFLPDFSMEGTNITSASNEPKNPAAYITVTEDGKEVYGGWIFALYPDLQRFEHPKISLKLSGYN